MRLLHPNYASDIFYIAADQTKKRSDADKDSQPDDQEAEGQEVRAVPFLSENGAAPYINVGPGDLVDIKMRGIRPIGSEAKTLIDLFHSGVLQFQVMALTSNGREVWSEPTVFTEQIEDTKANEISRRMVSSK